MHHMRDLELLHKQDFTERRYLEQFGKYWRSCQESEKYQVKINDIIGYMDTNNSVHIKVKTHSHISFEES